MELLRAGVLDELMMSDEDWMLSILEARTQKNKRQVQAEFEDIKEKIKKLKTKKLVKQENSKSNLVIDSKDNQQKAIKANTMIQKSSTNAPNYDLPIITSMQVDDSGSKYKEIGE
jgi:hypothetical protein